MTTPLHVASRKGLLTYHESPNGWRLDGTGFLGQPVSAMLADPRDGTLYAALALGHFGVKLHRSDDGGKSWQELDPPAYPASEGDGDGGKAPSVVLIWTLVAGGSDEPCVLWAGTLPGGLFRSPDRGESWSLVESLWDHPARKGWFGGGYDDPGIHSVCVDPRDSRKLTLGVSSGGVWRSDDGGDNWRQTGQGLRAAYLPPEQAYTLTNQDPHRLTRCPTAPDVIWCQHHNGIFLSEDGGETFSEIETAKPSVFGFAVAVHPTDPDTAWFVPAVKDECRVPVDQRMVVSRTTDRGKSFETFADGLPPVPAFDLVYRHGLAVDDAGERLAMGSTTGGLWIGSDGGERWTSVSAQLPPIAAVAWGLG